MNQFFNVCLYDVTNNKTIWFSKPDGSVTDVVILDDGWAPNVTKYVRDGEKTWSDVVEELECMTNVATRDEALALIEKLNALIHRAARDIEEKQQYTVRFHLQSQFSNAPHSAFTFVLSPPDDGNVITLSTDIQTAPPGQIKFKLRFKRTGAWVTSFSDTTYSSSFTTLVSPPSGFWELITQLPTDITIPTPISLSFSFTANGYSYVSVENLFLCFNVYNPGFYLVKNFIWESPFNMSTVTYPNWRLAISNKGYVIQDNTDLYTPDKRPYSILLSSLQPGTYAVFVSWRSVQPNVSHRLQIQFDNNAETRNMVLLSNDTSPHYQYAGTVTMTTPAKYVYLRTTIGHSTGFEIEKILFVKLKKTSTIITISDWVFERDATVTIENSVLKPVKTIFQTKQNLSKSVLETYNSVDIVADTKLFKALAIGNSPNAFSLRTSLDYYPVNSLPATIAYRPIRATFY